MNNPNSSEIIANSENKIVSKESIETDVETQTVSVIDAQKNNSGAIKKWLIVSMAIVLTFTAFFLFGKETDICFFSTCNEYTDSVGVEDAASIGNDFVAYAGGAATLVILTTLVGVPLIPAIIASAGVWFLIQMIQ